MHSADATIEDVMSANPAVDDSLHTADFFAWSEGQARLLRSVRALCKDMPADLDLDNIAEEIEDLGRAELHAVESHIQVILVHLLEAVSDSEAPAMPHWRTEVTTFQIDLVRKYSPSMRQRIDMDRTWRSAIRIARSSLRDYGGDLSEQVPTHCPFSVDDLVREEFDVDQAFRQILPRRKALRTSE